MDAGSWILVVALAVLLPGVILSMRAPTWPRPWPWRMSPSWIRARLALQALEFLVLFALFSRALTAPEDLGWKGSPTWPVWAILLAMLGVLPWLRGYMLALDRPSNHVEERQDVRRAIRALACMVPRERSAQQVLCLELHVVSLVHVVFFYGLVVHLGASVLGGTMAGVALGAVLILATLWRNPRQHKQWLLLVYALQCLLLFSAVGLAGVLVFTILLSMTEPRPAETLWDLRAWVGHLRRNTPRPSATSEAQDA